MFPIKTVMLNLIKHLSIGLSSFKFCFNQIDRFRNKFGMTNFKKQYAFTLSELLMALTIVGVIAVLTVPTLMTNVQNRMFATQIKNFSAEIKQLAQEQLIIHKTRDLSDTDFGEAAKLLTNGHFNIIKTCSANKSLTDCWKTKATCKDKVTYKILNGKVSAASLGNKLPTIVMKNGVMFSYNSKSAYGNYVVFLVDINGNDKPNVAGRDLFYIYMNYKGKIVDFPSAKNMNYSQKLEKCKSDRSAAQSYCYNILSDNNWKMDYACRIAALNDIKYYLTFISCNKNTSYREVWFL